VETDTADSGEGARLGRAKHLICEEVGAWTGGPSDPPSTYPPHSLPKAPPPYYAVPSVSPELFW
jgi:hypothetical protein